MRTETLLVGEWGREGVPGLEGTTVDTRDLVVGEHVVLVLGGEPLHTEQVQIPLVGVLDQLADLETGSRGAAAVALAVGGMAVAADTGNGKVAQRGLALGELALDIVHVGDNGGVVSSASGVRMVVRAVLERDSELKNGQKRKDHGHHVRGLAEVCHLGKTVVVLGFG